MTLRDFAFPARSRYAFLTVLLATASALPVQAADPTSVSEVVVTATKRSESLQKVPVSIQALTPQILTNHQVVSFDDYAKLLPSVSFQSFGPGQSQLYFRGISSGGDGLHTGSLPATGVYIDETPVTTIANAVDMHLYDIARIEALSGPQGTLYGASSLSGTLRIITNKPDPTKFSAGIDVQANTFTDGAPGGLVEGFVNIPITQHAAIRLVGFDEHDGGYIDAVPKTRTFTLSDGSSLPVNNAPYVKNNYNDVDTYGGRAALKVDLNNSWTVTPGVIYQHQVANGNFLYNPKLGYLKVAPFGPEKNTDDWYQAYLTIQGKIASWDLLYTGGYFRRTVDNAADYSYYAVAYDAAGSSYYVTFPDGHGGYLDPDQRFTGHDVYVKQSHEFRVSSPPQYPVRGVGGVFWQRQSDAVTANYIVPGIAAAGDPRAVPGAGDDIFYTRANRVDQDFAVFGEIAADLLPNLTLTLGGRYFTVDNTLAGFSGFIFNIDTASCLPSGISGLPPGPTGAPCADFNKTVKESGETHKANLSWRITPSKMVYFTYSTGFRPGGNNRRPGKPPYKHDTLTNFELGWKTAWFRNRLRVNGALFGETWDGVQYALSPPGENGVTSIFNAGQAVSYGVEADATWRIDQHWTLALTGTWLKAYLTTNFCNYDASGVATGCAPVGTPLPVQPNYKLNASARYEFEWAGLHNFLEADVQTQGGTRSALFNADAAILGPTDAFTTVDLSAGLSKNNWTFSIFVQNLFGDHGVLSRNVDCSITYCGPYGLVYPTKPRFVGLRLGAKY